IQRHDGAVREAVLGLVARRAAGLRIFEDGLAARFLARQVAPLARRYDEPLAQERGDELRAIHCHLVAVLELATPAVQSEADAQTRFEARAVAMPAVRPGGRHAAGEHRCLPRIPRSGFLAAMNRPRAIPPRNDLPLGHELVPNVAVVAPFGVAAGAGEP